MNEVEVWVRAWCAAAKRGGKSHWDCANDADACLKALRERFPKQKAD